MGATGGNDGDEITVDYRQSVKLTKNIGRDHVRCSNGHCWWCGHRWIMFKIKQVVESSRCSTRGFSAALSSQERIYQQREDQQPWREAGGAVLLNVLMGQLGVQRQPGEDEVKSWSY